MSEWPTVALQELAASPITYGVVKPGDPDPGGVPLIRGTDVRGGRVMRDQLRTITAEVSHQYSRTLLQGGELLISLVGNPGEPAVVPQELAGANIARQVGLVRLGPLADAHFISYFLQSPLGRRLTAALTYGSVQQVINLRDLKALRVPLPELSVQRATVDVLRALDEKIDCNRRLAHVAWDLARAAYDLSTLVAPTRPLREVLELRYGKPLAAATRRTGSVPVVGSGGVVGRHDEALVPGPGVVVGRKGTVGSVYYLAQDFFPIDTTFYARPLEPELPMLFVFFTLQRAGLRDLNSDSAVPGLNRARALDQAVPVADAEALSGFFATAQPLVTRAEAADTESVVLSQLRDELLPALMSGELRLREAEELVGEAV